MYGIFVWIGTSMYKKSDAIKVFNRLAAAKKYADKLNEVESIYAVREMSLIVRE